MGSDWRPKTKQGIGGKIVRFRSGKVRDRVRNRVMDNWSPIWTRSPIWSYQFWRLLNSDRRSEPNTMLHKITSDNCIRVSLHIIHLLSIYFFVETVGINW